MVRSLADKKKKNIMRIKNKLKFRLTFLNKNVLPAMYKDFKISFLF